MFGRKIQIYEKRKQTDNDKKDGQSVKTRCPFDHIKDHAATPVMVDEWTIGIGVRVKVGIRYQVVQDEQFAIFEMTPDITVGDIDWKRQKISID